MITKKKVINVTDEKWRKLYTRTKKVATLKLNTVEHISSEIENETRKERK